MTQIIFKKSNMKTKELQNRLKAAEAEIAEVRRLMQEEESKSKPPKWEDLEEIEGWYITAACDIAYFKCLTHEINSNTFPTREQAEATIAESQLLQLRDSKFYRNGWEPDWHSEDLKWCINANKGVLKISWSTTHSNIWSFQDEDTAERFLSDQRELLEIWAKKIMS